MKWPLFIILLLTFSGCHQTTKCPYNSGDLLFVADNSGMGEAIAAATGAQTHVAILECSDQGQMVIEALPSKGVIRHSYADFLKALQEDLPKPESAITIKRISDKNIGESAVKLAKTFIGLPYDQYFMPDNQRYYCSELVFDSYYSTDNKRIFSAKPMNWRNPDQTMPQYWIDHFGKLGVPIPEGVLGTNPTDMLKECAEVGIF